MKIKLIFAFAFLALLITLQPASLSADPGDPDDLKRASRPDPLGDNQQALMVKAMAAKLNGKAYGKKHEVARGQPHVVTKAECVAAGTAEWVLTAPW